MTVCNLSPTLKNNRSATIGTTIGASGNALFYSGAIPSDPSQTPAGTLLATCALSSTAGTASGGVFTFGAITQATTGVQAGTVGFCRIATSAGVGVVDLDVGTTAAFSVVMNSTTIAAGGPVVVNSATITEG